MYSLHIAIFYTIPDIARVVKDAAVFFLALFLFGVSNHDNFL